MISLGDAKSVVVVFVMRGCGACTEFKPRLKRIAKKYQNVVPTLVVSAEDPDGNALANRYGIDATPTMLVMRKWSPRTEKIEGAVSDEEIVQVYEMARGA